jgi:hypothetical protein
MVGDDVEDVNGRESEVRPIVHRSRVRSLGRDIWVERSEGRDRGAGIEVASPLHLGPPADHPSSPSAIGRCDQDTTRCTTSV